MECIKLRMPKLEQHFSKLCWQVFLREDFEDKLPLNSELTSSHLEDEVAIASLAQTILPPKGLENYLQEQERNLIITALKQTGWNKTQAAELLGTTFRSLRYRMKKLEIEEDE